MTMLKRITELTEITDKAERVEKSEAVATIMFNEGANLVALGVVVEDPEDYNDGVVRFTYPEKYLDTVLTGGQPPETYLTNLLKSVTYDAIVYTLGLDMIQRNDFDAALLESTVEAVFESVYKGFEGTPRPGESWTMNKYYVAMEKQADELKEYVEFVKEKMKNYLFYC